MADFKQQVRKKNFQKTVMVVGLGEVGEPLSEIIQENFNCVKVDESPVEFNEELSVMHLCYPYQISDFNGKFEGDLEWFLKRLYNNQIIMKGGEDHGQGQEVGV